MRRRGLGCSCCGFGGLAVSSLSLLFCCFLDMWRVCLFVGVFWGFEDLRLWVGCAICVILFKYFSGKSRGAGLQLKTRMSGEVLTDISRWCRKEGDR